LATTTGGGTDSKVNRLGPGTGAIANLLCAGASKASRLTGKARRFSPLREDAFGVGDPDGGKDGFKERDCEGEVGAVLGDLDELEEPEDPE
jgi:hypothetical protein